ncbi:helix-turn-helix transcriptional regulator [Streptomyces kunmingensis]|uniref:Helix-turn-helix transcriptional regulator n=1 Tax=Streptomyces kunmingensis TaxID=68225 RepID=A0ABU6CIF9_9ACTN|nr:helix-turn-helix transcriptional regulator [Streptomyces kunmingensis]MEB3964510.1 helix-turn-helix transcriptional regulator [Streptomyces kunmingensis]
MTTMTQDARPTEVRRHELAGFLRSRRERITPEEVGLPRGRRRRTPGLRREEVAHLSAVGVTWYTWLEQARSIQVSAQVLDALARTLRLDAAERAHLFGLAGAVDPTPAASCPTLTPELRQMLTQLEPMPACVQNSRYDILAYNRTYGRLLCDLDAIAPEDRNMMLLAFTHEQWRSAIVHRDDVLRLMAAKFRAGMADHLAEPAWKLVLKRLLDESAEFRELWGRHEVVRSQPNRVKHFLNPYVGPVAVAHTDLWLGRDSGARMVTYTPVDDVSRERIGRLYELALSATG